MAYADYQGGVGLPKQQPYFPTAQLGGGSGFNERMGSLLGDQPFQATGGVGGGLAALAVPQPNGTLPANTRQQNLQSVQQAYAAPLPGGLTTGQGMQEDPYGIGGAFAGGGLSGGTAISGSIGGQRMPGDLGYLNGLLQQSASPVSASDPNIAPAFAAGRVADQRNIDRQRAALAEQLGGAGLGDSGAMSTKTAGIQQRVGEQQALRESGMLYDESNARRNALLQALGLDQTRYGFDNNLGYQLAALQAQLNNQAVQPFF